MLISTGIAHCIIASKWKCFSMVSSLSLLFKGTETAKPKTLAKYSNTLFFCCNLYLLFLRPCCENTFNIASIVSEKSGN